VVIHPLTDDRRILPVDKTGELVSAAPGFQLVISYNPGYQHATKDLKPSTRQRFVTLEFDFPPPALEAEIVMHESGVDRRIAKELVELARAGGGEAGALDQEALGLSHSLGLRASPRSGRARRPADRGRR
jgi:hypothetical protein